MSSLLRVWSLLLVSSVAATLVASVGSHTLAQGPAAEEQTPVRAKKFDPEDGEVLKRSPKALRVWFNRQPDPAASRLVLIGPAGEMRVEGLHTMGYEDLMIAVVGPIPAGEYLARWQFTGLDGEKAAGEWEFSIASPE